MLKRILLQIVLTLCLSQAYANIWDHNQYAKNTVITGKYENGEALLGIHFQLEDGWKIYDNVQHDLGFPTSVEFLKTRNIDGMEVVFPKSTRFEEEGGFITHGYKNDVVLPIKITVIDAVQDISAKLELSFALCREVCIPVAKTLYVIVPPGEYNKKNYKLIKSYIAKSTSAGQSLLWIVISAIIAGFILNFMPCVLPVLFLKIFHFMEKRKEQKEDIILISLGTILGIFFTFFVFSLFVFALKITGQNIGWGLHFQSPVFIASLAIIVTIFACNILGFFTINIPNGLSNRINKMTNVDSRFAKHFFTGILVTILATPCSAPFLGTAIAFALTGSYFQISLIFASIALGLSLPYIALIFWPNLLYLLPKPGKWMDTLKKIMGIFLVATALWLIFVIKQQIGALGMIIFALELIVIFQFLKFQNNIINFIGKKAFTILIVLNLSMAFIAVNYFHSTHNVTNNQSSQWQDYHQIDIAKEIADNKVVFVNITADWCITCKFNELRVLSRKEIKELFNLKEVIAVKADYTNYDKKIQKLLHSVNRFAIPTYIIFSKKHPKGLVLGELLGVDSLKQQVQDEISAL